MGTEPPTLAGSHDQTSDDGLLCPACGYDLRGSMDVDRCPECGLAIDRASLRTSGFPWAHRRKIGRVRAYLRTVWYVAMGSGQSANELAKPQDPADARAFRRATATLLAVVFLTAFAAVVVDEGGLLFLTPQPMGGRMMQVTILQGYELDLAVPWGAGATRWPIIPICLVLLAIYLTGAQRLLFRLSSFPAVHRQRASAVALYAAAPLALLLPAIVLLLGHVPLRWVLDRAGLSHDLLLLVPLASSVFVLLALLATLGRAGQWVARARHAGWVTACWGAAQLLGLWLLGILIILGFFPWAVGFLWIVFDSLR